MSAFGIHPDTGLKTYNEKSSKEAVLICGKRCVFGDEYEMPYRGDYSEIAKAYMPLHIKGDTLEIIINTTARMHTARNADELHAVYVSLIGKLKYNYSDFLFIVLQNKELNEKFGFTEQYLLDTYYNEDGRFKSMEELAKQGRPSTVKCNPEVDKQLDLIRCYMDILDESIDEFKSNNVDNKNDAADKLKTLAVAINNTVAEIEPTVLTEEQLTELNDIEHKMKDADIEATIKEAEKLVSSKATDEISKDHENIQDDERPFRFK